MSWLQQIGLLGVYKGYGGNAKLVQGLGLRALGLDLWVLEFRV